MAKHSQDRPDLFREGSVYCNVLHQIIRLRPTGVDNLADVDRSQYGKDRHGAKVITDSADAESFVFYNGARGGFQRAKGAEMIRPRE